jgi:hypothetical protein
MTAIRPVTVALRSGSEAQYSWSTSVSVTRKGDLKIWDGLRQRSFHPAGEWLSFTVEAETPAARAAARAAASRPLVAD